MYINNKFRWFGIPILICILTTCQVKKPNDPGGTARIKLSVQISETDDSNSYLFPFTSSIPVMKSNDIKNIPLSSLSIEGVQIVFYDVDMDTGALFNNYNRYSDELDSALSSHTGDVTDFEGYWLARDQIELDIVASGKHWIEKRGQLEIDGHHATGEFQLSEGLKACRVGCFGHEELQYVGTSISVETNSAFFFVVSGEEQNVSVGVYSVSGYYWY